MHKMTSDELKFKVKNYIYLENEITSGISYPPGFIQEHRYFTSTKNVRLYTNREGGARECYSPLIVEGKGEVLISKQCTGWNK